MMSHFIAAFSRTLLHSLWQGLIFAMIAGMVLLCTRGSRSVLRYNLLLVLFFMTTAVISFTFLVEWNNHQLLPGIFNDPGQVADGASFSFLYPVTLFLDGHSSLVVIAWALVFSIKSLRMLGSLHYTGRLRKTAVQGASPYWKQKTADLSAMLGIKKTVQLVESRLIKIPVVIGHLKPLILMPAGLLVHLPPGEVEAVLLHELAHIRRGDYLVNAIQHFMENLFFFNPGLLWISVLLREERENCCDDIAIAATNNKKQFIEALISFKQYAVHPRMLVNAFPSRRNLLLLRVQRIVHNKNNTLNTVEKLFMLGSAAMLFLFFFGIGGTASLSVAKENRLPVVQGAVFKAARILPIATIKKNTITPVTEVSVKSAVDENCATDEQPKELEEEQPDPETVTLTAKQMAEADRLQSIIDRQQAEADRIQAIEDKEQADKDIAQAILDKEQSDKDRIEARAERAEANCNTIVGKKIKAKPVNAHHLEQD